MQVNHQEDQKANTKDSTVSKKQTSSIDTGAKPAQCYTTDTWEPCSANSWTIHSEYLGPKICIDLQCQPNDT